MKPTAVTKSNVATNLALRYLLPSSAEDQADAWQGLIAVCLRALFSGRPRFLYPLPHLQHAAFRFQHEHRTRYYEYESAEPTTIKGETRLFVEGWLDKEFEPHRAQSPAEINSPANLKKFRYIGRRCRFAVVDEIRRRARERGKSEQHPILELPDKAKSASEVKRLAKQSVLSRLLKADVLKLARAPQLEQVLSTRASVALEAIRSGLAAGEITQKGDAAKVVAKVSNVGVRQARTYIADLIAELTEQPTLAAVFGIVSRFESLPLLLRERETILSKASIVRKSYNPKSDNETEAWLRGLIHAGPSSIAEERATRRMLLEERDAEEDAADEEADEEEQ